jgi:manganese/zinc/iron transport system substrate-binding protein
LRNVVVALVLIAASAAFVATIYYTKQSAGSATRNRTLDAATSQPLRVVTTTGMVGDLVARVGGPVVEVESLMGAGIDPHLYKASESDVRKMAAADIIFYSGLHLEGKLTEVFEQMEGRGIPTVPITRSLAEEDLLVVDEASGSHDPHVWFDVALWAQATNVIVDTLGEARPGYADLLVRRGEMTRTELLVLDEWARNRIATVPRKKRVLVTAHDAFGYFARAYDLEVRAVQGVSTATEAGAADIQRLADFMATNRIPALFVESSVPPAVTRALMAAVVARGHKVEIGGELYSDAMGPAGTAADNYIGMVRHNVNTIVTGLNR